MRNIDNVEVAAVSGGVSDEHASSLFGAYMCRQMFVNATTNYPVQGYNIGHFGAQVVGMVVGAVVGRVVHNVVRDYVNPVADAVTP